MDIGVRSGAWRTPQWRQAIESYWDEVVSALIARIALEGHPAAKVSPERWPGFELKRARLLNLFGRLRGVLAALPDSAEVMTEVDLQTADGILRGRADLIVRSPTEHFLVDYKTGGVVDEFGAVREHYLSQLRLYACLEFEVSGTWPKSAHIYPLSGQPVEIDVNPTTCAAVAAEARRLIRVFDEQAGKQPASPSTAHCRQCDYACHCDAFWGAIDDTWSPVLQALRGVAGPVSHGQIPVLSFAVKSEAGSCGTGEVQIRAIDLLEHPVASALREGDDVRLVGLREEAGRGTYRLPPWGRMRVEPRAPSS
jgi:CRISPR/Cas system-associated exonuclease Cas4 (RecB family)